MLLENKNAVIYGAGGAIGGATARAFAREGARLFLTGRRRATVDPVASEVRTAGGVAEVAELDALDERAIEEHLAGVVERAGHVDVSFNAAGIPQEGIQGIPLVELPAESFALPVQMYSTSHFLTARAAARHMLRQRSGVILTLTATRARFAAPLVGGMGPVWGRWRRSPVASPPSSDRTASASSACDRTASRRRTRSGWCTGCTPGARA